MKGAPLFPQFHAVGGQFPVQRGQGPLRQSALPQEASPNAQGARYREQEAQGGAAFAAGKLNLGRGDISDRMDAKGVPFLPDLRSHGPQASDRGQNISGKPVAANPRLLF